MKFKWNDKEWYIDGYLAETLNSLAYNIKDDWDFVLLITGDRGVRVGKSVLAMTVCAYLAMKIEELKLNKEPYTINNVFFDNKVMVDMAQKLPPYSIVHYDEGREGLAATKAMKGFQQDLLDFFAECGQLNHIFVIVCPDFFELKENIAVARSECLINVYRKEQVCQRKGMNIVKFNRGYFEFFNKHKKQYLFDLSKSTRKKNYGLIKANFTGSFTNQYTIDEELYKQKKKDSLARFAERHKEEKLTREQKLIDNWIHVQKNMGKTSIEIAPAYEAMFGVPMTPNGIVKREGWKRPLDRNSAGLEANPLENRNSEVQGASYINNTYQKASVLPKITQDLH